MVIAWRNCTKIVMKNLRKSMITTNDLAPNDKWGQGRGFKWGGIGGVSDKCF
jgi:hypothetical protein